MARYEHPSAILLAALLGTLLLAPVQAAKAGDLDAVGALYLRLPLSVDGQGFRPPNLGLRLGPSIGIKGGGLRVESRPRFLLDRAVSLETDGRGRGRLTIAAFSWNWQMPALEDLGLSLGTSGLEPQIAAGNLPRK